MICQTCGTTDAEWWRPTIGTDPCIPATYGYVYRVDCYPCWESVRAWERQFDVID